MINENRRSRLLLYGGLAVFFVWVALPYLWVFRTAVLTNFGAVSTDTPLIPFQSEYFTLSNFATVWEQYNFAHFFKNSAIVAFGCTFLSLILGIPAAYAFARLDFPGRKGLFYTMVVTIMFPWIVLTVPVYDIFNQLDLLNTMVGLIVALTIFVMPLVIWLLQGFFRQGIPEDIEEAALVDGTTELGAFFRVVLPLSMPAIASTALFAFLMAWNNFLWVFVLSSDESVRTATVAIHYMVGSDTFRDWAAMMTGVTMLVLPPLLFYTLSQRYVGEGLSGV